MIRAIIVDDEYIVRKGLRETIDWSRYGIKIIGEAENGLQALELIRKLPVDLAMVDVTMPGMTGLELIEAIQQIDAAVVTVVISCYANFDYAQQAIRQGALDYLVKTELEEEKLEQNLVRVACKVREIIEHRKKINQLDNEQEEIQTKIMELLTEKVWFLDRQAFEEIRIACEALKHVTKDFLEQIARELQHQETMYRLPSGCFLLKSYENQTIGKDLFLQIQQAANHAVSHFLKTGYREEMVWLVLSAIYYLCNNPDKITNQSMLCEKFSISRSYFSKIFPDLMGTTFQVYIGWVRIETAKRLIRFRQVPLDEIAFCIGLEDEKYFNKIFQKETGMTLAMYQQHVINEEKS